MQKVPILMSAGRLATLLLLLPHFLTAGPRAAAAEEVVFSVAISMKEVTEEMGRHFMRARPGITLRYNFGSSGELQKQIEAGAPVDLFISAAQVQMDALERNRLIMPATRRVFARNLLTVIVPANSSLDLAKPADLLGPRIQRIVIGNPKTVPAGQYAEESLRSLGLLGRLRPKLVYVENVRQALEYASRGEVDAGFVYATDAAVRVGRIKEAFRPPPESYGPILYPVAVIAASRHRPVGESFIDLLLSREGQAALSRHGFQAPPEGAQ